MRLGGGLLCVCRAADHLDEEAFILFDLDNDTRRCRLSVRCVMSQTCQGVIYKNRGFKPSTLASNYNLESELGSSYAPSVTA